MAINWREMDGKCSKCQSKCCFQIIKTESRDKQEEKMGSLGRVVTESIYSQCIGC